MFLVMADNYIHMTTILHTKNHTVFQSVSFWKLDMFPS